MSYTHTKITGKYRFTGRTAKILSTDEIAQIDDIGEAVEQLETDIADIEAGSVSDDSITNAKLADDVKIGSLAALNTTEKASVVDAVNEVDANADAAASAAAAAQSTANTAATNASAALSASTAAASAAADAKGDATTALAAVDGIGTLSTLNTTAKSDLVSAVNEVNGKAVAAYNNNSLLETDGTEKACLVNGITLIEGGTGIADLTLAAPTAGARAVIRIASIDSGDVVVTCADGVTVDGENDIMTFDAADEMIDLVYKSATEWAIVQNVGGVALRATTE